MAEAKLNVKVFSPYETFFEGSAVSVSAKNSAGNFDVLGDHSNFFSLLTGGRVTVDTGRERVEVAVGNGLMKVTNNRVTVFADV